MGLGDFYNNVVQSNGQQTSNIQGAFQNAPGLYSQYQQQRAANDARLSPDNVSDPFAQSIARIMNGEDPVQVAREHKAQQTAPRPMMGAQEAAAQPPQQGLAPPQAAAPPQAPVQNLGQGSGLAPSYGPATQGAAQAQMPDVSVSRGPVDSNGDGMRTPLKASNAFAMQRNPDYGPTGMPPQQPQQAPQRSGMPAPRTPAEWDIAMKMAPIMAGERKSENKPYTDQIALELLRQRGKGTLQDDAQAATADEKTKDRAAKKEADTASNDIKDRHLQYLWASMRSRNALLEKKIEQGSIEDKVLIAKIGALAKVLSGDIPAGMNRDSVRDYIDTLQDDIDKADKEAENQPKKTTKKTTIKAESHSGPVGYKVGGVYSLGGKKRKVTGFKPDGTLITVQVGE